MKTLSLLLPLLLIAGCAENTEDEDITPPGPPAFALKGSDTLQIETGIDADPDGILLQWSLPEDADGDLAGVHIYRSISPDSVFQPLTLFDSPLLVEASRTSHLDSDSEVMPVIPAGAQRFWYFLRAVDDAGNESSPSDTATYRLWFPAENIALERDTADYKCHLVLYNLDLAIEAVLLKFTDGHFYRCITLAEDLQQVMDYYLPFTALPEPVHPDSLMLRVDLLVQDEMTITLPSNPDRFHLSGSETNWISITVNGE